MSTPLIDVIEALPSPLLRSTRTSVPPLREMDTWAATHIQLTERALEQRLSVSPAPPPRLHEAIHYAMFAGGKRLRPLLCHAAGELTGAADDALAASAAAIEMIHVFSLIQDDLPAMDNDTLRHGKPTVHIVYGEAMALLVCDALFSLAFLTIDEAPLSDQCRVALNRELAMASGLHGLVTGQCIDLMSVATHLGMAELEHMDRLKTGALIRAAVRMGALCGSDGPLDPSMARALDDYANTIGVAFQVVDDILDVTSETATLGKTAGKDAQANKPTYVSELGVDAARLLAGQLRLRAQDILEPWGASAVRLQDLACRMIDRIH